MTSSLLLTLGLAIATCAAAGYIIWNLYYRHLAAERKFPARAEPTIKDFVGLRSPERRDYEILAAYFVDGFLAYASKEGGRASYPGLKSTNLHGADEIEGFSRMAPLLAALTCEPGSNALALPSGSVVDVGGILARGLTAGTSPTSCDYWGRIVDGDQRIVEAADIALAIWIARDTVWRRLPRETRACVVEWLSGVNDRRTVDNNWHLFVAQVNAILKDLGERHREDEITPRLARIGDFHLGDGWFRDGADGEIDYYNAWGFHYHLLWLMRIDPALGADLAQPMRRFAQQYIHLFGPNGFPAMGRSICYRLAATAPLVQQSANPNPPVEARQARRALDLTWRFFLANGAVRRGRITQGYCGDDPRVLQDYSGPASSLWSLRSLVAALSIPEDHPFWSETPAPLPVETSDFDVGFAACGLRAVGTRANGNVRLVMQKQSNSTHGPKQKLKAYRLIERLKDFIDGGVRRPDNDQAAYLASHYDSNEPFLDCPGLVLIKEPVSPARTPVAQ